MIELAIFIALSVGKLVVEERSFKSSAKIIFFPRRIKSQLMFQLLMKFEGISPKKAIESLPAKLNFLEFSPFLPARDIHLEEDSTLARRAPIKNEYTRYMTTIS